MQDLRWWKVDWVNGQEYEIEAYSPAQAVSQCIREFDLSTERMGQQTSRGLKFEVYVNLMED
jgi:hypothetical protein